MASCENVLMRRGPPGVAGRRAAVANCHVVCCTPRAIHAARHTQHAMLQCHVRNAEDRVRPSTPLRGGGRRVRLASTRSTLSTGRTAEDRVGRPHRLALRADLRRVHAPHEPVQSSAVQGRSVQRMAGQLSAVQCSAVQPSPRLTCMALRPQWHSPDAAGRRHRNMHFVLGHPLRKNI